MNAEEFKLKGYTPYTDKHGLCIDWETSGAAKDAVTPRDHTASYQGLAIGAVVFDLDTFEPVDTMYALVKFDGSRYQWSDFAEGIHGLSREHLAEHGETQEKVAEQFLTMFLKYFSPQSKILMLGHNTAFDIAFTQQLLEQFGCMFQLKTTVLDTSIAGLMALGLYRSNDIFKHLGLPDRGTHNALEDCIMTIEAARRIREVAQLGYALAYGE
jgi:DNA polymerase III epsilon subunit-like protein